MPGEFFSSICFCSQSHHLFQLYMRSFELHRMRKMDNSLDAFTIEISCCDMQSKCYTRYAVYIKVIPIKLENKKRVGLMFYNCRCQITHPFFHPRVRSVALPHGSSAPTELSSGPTSPHPTLNRGAASVRPTLPVRILHCAVHRTRDRP